MSELEEAWNNALDQLARGAAVKRLCNKCAATISFIGVLTEKQLKEIDPETYVCPDCQSS